MRLFLFVLVCAAATAARATPLKLIGFFDDPVGYSAGTDPETDEGDDDAEAESETAEPPPANPGIRYSADLTDDALRRLWKEDPSALGTISMGFADRGRLINAAHMPLSDAWSCARPDLAWGTQETIDGLEIAFRAVRQQFPGSAPGRVSHIGGHDGGYLRPHRSHQSGRDADIGFYYLGDTMPPPRARRERLMDPARNWAFLRALITQTDVQLILVDRSIQKVLRDYAIGAGEDPVWVNSLFAGQHALIQHARHHRDHFHVRFYAPRSQELGRRLQPLLADRPEQNLVLHKVRRGDTLGRIARRTGSSVAMIRKANHLRRETLHLGQQLKIPLRGACTRCPVPPPVVVPPRHVPPAAGAALASG